ncbi:aminotransferase class I/II-fold pyridoxal phosphate-dependent enzyme [Luteimicrobium xylanilyticum]|uniref:HTH-type transcriptional regulator TauR n=1 Tax=Luteimicrobium xylanilyticum TaxID=1133546 RepID=A0A5P9Q8S1_9MICO|nr:aminotransferase class I/II-fold pyridoxal phosphate-dependent enzyme [Luteimicrobium xylanilyticum]QFU97838.1 HTH-type transcriptional regulator TauR [Luteimicrobium xylanilyticum]
MTEPSTTRRTPPGRPRVVSADALAAHLDGRSPRAVAASVARLLRAGELRPGDRLPTVRALAARLGTSPATVGSAWRALADVGMVAPRGRAGTFVLPEPASWLPPGYRRLADGARRELDLSAGTPHPSLLPDLTAALTRAGKEAGATADSYLAPPVLPELETLLRASWPFAPERVTVVDGAMDGVARTLEQVAGFGDRVAVEDPGFPPVFDLLDQLGCERVALELDGAGVTPGSLDAALRAGVVAVVLQPRAHNPTGASLTPTRARDLAAVVRRHDPGVLVVEDDHAGEIAAVRDVSVGTYLPGRVVRVRSFSKSHGPDLRIAALGGPASVVDALVARRMLGPGWTSRLLQRVLAHLLTDAHAVDAVAHAARMYHARRRALVDALRAEGVALPDGAGINVWVPVDDESRALERLAAAGVRAAPGSPFQHGREDAPPHLRVTISGLDGDAERLARLLAVAARPDGAAATR